MENRTTFTQRIARIQEDRGIQTPISGQITPFHARSRQREQMLRGRARGVVYLFAGFCAGLVVMALVASAPEMTALAAL